VISLPKYRIYTVYTYKCMVLANPRGAQCHTFGRCTWCVVLKNRPPRQQMQTICLFVVTTLGKIEATLTFHNVKMEGIRSPFPLTSTRMGSPSSCEEVQQIGRYKEWMNGGVTCGLGDGAHVCYSFFRSLCCVGIFWSVRKQNIPFTSAAKIGPASCKDNELCMHTLYITSLRGAANFKLSSSPALFGSTACVRVCVSM